ncbi:MAG: type II toxin-antitoxin system VapC family toxin [Verrucomicrobiota bacterium]
MSGFLLDTNILSELRKQDRCDPGVRAWFEQCPEGQLYVSVLVLGQIRRGIERIRARDPRQADALEAWLESITQGYEERLLPVDRRVADRWGALGAHQPIAPVDGLLAATALTHQLTLVTRNVADVESTGVKVLNPFSQPSPRIEPGGPRRRP